MSVKACLIRAHGGPEVLRLEEVPDPRPGPGEALVRVRAAAVNHLDVWVRRGRGVIGAGGLVLGSDGAGVVEAVGDGTRGIAVGDEVVVYPGLSCRACAWCRRGEQSECPTFALLGVARNGTFAERVVLPVENLLRKPEHLGFEEAAALTLDHVTAWRMLRRAGLGGGETLLIHGIGGGAALAALQIARAVGARVIVTSSSDEKLERARALGADLGFNYRTKPDLAQAIRDASGGVDVAFDSVGGATLALDLAVLRRGGRAVFCGVTGGDRAELDLRALYWNQITLIGSTLGSDEDARRTIDLVRANRMVPVIDRVVPLDEVRAAAERLERGEQFGKIVLAIA